MEPGRDEQVAHLERLAAALASNGYAIEWARLNRVPEVTVRSSGEHGLADRVQCRPDTSGAWCFWWSWNTKQPIGAAADIESAAARVMAVLRPVGGQS
ncbi:MAG TPA: hypothetical protein VGG25_24290 [Streptosporangiaceae bacterium]|jgi:hypothetical protein